MELGNVFTKGNNLPSSTATTGNQKKSTTARCCLFSCLGCGGLGLIGFVLLGLMLQNSTRNPSIGDPMVREGFEKKSKPSLPLEKKYTAFGPKKVQAKEFASHQDFFKHYKIWYPSELETNSAKQYPIVIFSNGTGVTYPRYEPIFRHLASWGFVAIGNDDPSSLTGKSTSLTLDYILSHNQKPQSVFYRKLDIKHIGVTGHSQGGGGAVHAVTNFNNGRQFTSLYTASNTSPSSDASDSQNPWWYDTAKIRIPFFMVAATGQGDANFLAPLARLNEGFDKIQKNVPAVMARRKNVDHGGTLTDADGYMTAWFRYTLMNDREAKQVFVGKTPELLKNSANWQDVKIKNFNLK